MRSRALIIFCRTPEAEARAKNLPVARMARIFEAVLAMWVRAAQAADAEPFIASSAEHRARLLAIAPQASWIEQPNGSFGARLSTVTTAVFARGFESVALTGIDTPPMDLRAVFECGTNVIVPAKDGGVNVIGLIVNAPELLASLRPRQHDAAAHCAQVLEAVVLPASTDLDDCGDLRRALHDPAWIPLHHLLARASIDTRVAVMLLAPGVESFVTRAPPVLQ
jgi:glycosyltransferase A (GT-A) superfamily protein (DUF2064 family)